MRGKRMPDKLRAKAVGLALVTGVPDAAKAMGVSQRNIRRWKQDPELSELVLSASGELLDAMKAVMWVGLDEVHKGLESSEEPLKSKSDALFGLIDRHQLLSGDVTSRSEVSTFHGYNDHEKRAIADLLRQALAGDGAASGPAGDAEGAAMVSAGTPGADSPTG